MSIQIGGYNADGPFGNVSSLQARSGVYVILGKPQATANWNVVDVGESGDVKDRVAKHDREPCWRGLGHSELAVAAIYADQRNRMLIERELRTKYNPPCGQI
ncbi:MAG: hypothetical protein AAFW46_03705 [Pseudomonadota bacterium]